MAALWTDSGWITLNLGNECRVNTSSRRQELWATARDRRDTAVNRCADYVPRVESELARIWRRGGERWRGRWSSAERLVAGLVLLAPNGADLLLDWDDKLRLGRRNEICLFVPDLFGAMARTGRRNAGALSTWDTAMTGAFGRGADTAVVAQCCLLLWGGLVTGELSSQRFAVRQTVSSDFSTGSRGWRYRGKRGSAVVLLWSLVEVGKERGGGAKCPLGVEF